MSSRIQRIKSRDARDNWTAVLADVEAGGEVIIERYNQPIARIIPYVEHTMSITLPSRFDRSVIEQNWYNHIAAGDYTEAQQHALVSALMTAYETEIDNAVEDGQVTLGNPSEATVSDHLTDLDSSYWDAPFQAASVAVYDRYAAIESAVLNAK